MGIETCLGLVALYYNLLIGAILLAAFLWLFHISDNKVYIKPWKVLFFAGAAYMVEEILVVFRVHNLAKIPAYTDGIFGIIIVTLFIYMVLLQKEYVEKYKK